MLDSNHCATEELFDSDMDIGGEESSKRFKPQTFEELINSDGFSETIQTPTNISPIELLFLILKFSAKNKLSVSILSGLLSLINSIFKESIFPESRYMIDKFFNGNPNSHFYAICPNRKCNAHLGRIEKLEPDSKCKDCDSIVDQIDHASDNFYVMMDPSESIIKLLKTHENYYDSVINGRTNDTSDYKDIYDVYLYKKFLSSLSPDDRKQYVTLTFNSDGAAPFKSSPLSVWPIYLMVNEIPVQDRFKNIIPCALWFNRKKPEMKSFLKVFVNMMNDITTNGISCVIKGKELKLKIYTLVSCVDTVARAPMQGLTQFNGKFGCNWCLHPTKWYRGSKYPIKIVPLRTMEGTMKDLANLRSGNMTHGFKSLTPLINLKSFNIIEGFTPDYMHCILAGVGKQIFNYFINARNFEFYQEYVENLKFPYQVCRITLSLSMSKYWKCQEWENWILYVSLPLLSLTYKQDLLEYWALLVHRLFILLKNDISTIEFDRVDQMLHIFVAKTQQNLKKKAMTFNVHQLLHICTSVRNWGPVWAHSAFAFEEGNHELLQAIHSGEGIISQILCYININQCIAKLQKKKYIPKIAI
ncbi:hypothetical protein TKK_0016239 [Trichogramma kaykai]